MPRSIFITGASSGIGEALAVEFARRGYAVAIAARRLDRLDALAARLKGLGATAVLPLALDVTDFVSIDAALGRAASEFGASTFQLSGRFAASERSAMMAFSFSPQRPVPGIASSTVPGRSEIARASAISSSRLA